MNLTMNNLIRYILLLLFCSGSLLNGAGQVTDFTLDQFRPGSTQTDIPLFQGEKLVKVTISTNLRTVIFDVGDDRESHPATLRYLEGNDTIPLEVMLKTRGNFRRDRSTCDFPPLRIEFDENIPPGMLFSGMKDVKMVTHCRDRSINQRYVLEEYMIYKIYNLFTDLSYKVRLAQVTYTDTEDRIKPIHQFAFFIEPTGKMAERIGGREIELKGLALNHLNHPQINLFTVFQYFIANTDWSIRALHNVKLVSFSSEPMAIPIPYDFDFSGVINTYYSAPDSAFGISSVRTRLFRSNCRKLEELVPTFDLFRDKKQQIYDLYRDFPYYEENRVKKILKFYDEFFDTLSNEKKARREFEQCSDLP